MNTIGKFKKPKNSIKSFWIFRSNLKTLEDYHSIKDLHIFKNKCWDFYLLQGIWFLENNIFDQVIIWRLSEKDISPIIFEVNGKQFIQQWVKNFNDVFKYLSPTITFFRGGFPEYCDITKKDPKFFGLKLYLAAGKRLFPQYGGIYDKILIEDEKDSTKINCIPFYKTANNNIFKSLNIKKKYDVCLISNFTQIKYKGIDFIIDQICKDPFLRTIKFCHIGNKPEVGINLCAKNKIKNIQFLGSLNREKINLILNQSNFAIVNSNKLDGCPRISSEILTSETPLLINEETRLLNDYKKFGVIEFNTLNFISKFKEMNKRFLILKQELNGNKNDLLMNNICKKNINLW